MKGILFKPDMIQAIIEGRKTQTRRVVKFRTPRRNPISSLSAHGGIYSMGDTARELEAIEKGIIKPGISLSRYQVGETVYIKEELLLNPIFGEAGYRDGSPVFIYNEELIKTRHILQWRWRSDVLSSRCMPREAARHFITITDVRAERLQEITSADLAREGIYSLQQKTELKGFAPMTIFRNLWNSINKDYPWESNPWVWVYTFRRGNEQN